MNTAITNLATLVGTLPQDTEETTIVAWVSAELAALASTISGKNVGATGETGNNALITASASNNNVTVESTQKLRDAVAAAETALQDSDFATIGAAAAKAIVADAITAAETPAQAGTGE